MNYNISLKRLNLLKGHIQLSKDARREQATSTFDLTHAQQKVWPQLPAGYFEALECASEIHGIIEPSLHQGPHEKMRYDSFDFMFKLTRKMIEKGYTSVQKIADNIDAFLFGVVSTGLINLTTTARFTTHIGLYCKTIKNLGTERHNQILLDSISCKYIGCFCLTELGHGSNAKGLETTAIYDKETQEFVLNTPTETSRKFWIGNLAK